MMLVRYVLSSAWALALGVHAQTFPVSNPQCPVSPLPAPGVVCGKYTEKDCGGALTTCKYCASSASRDTTSTAGSDYFGQVREYTDYPIPPTDYFLDVEDYMFYHMLHVEYLVEFSKNPMPFQTALSLPYCGLDSDVNLDQRDLMKRGWFKDLKKAAKQAGDGLTGTLKKIGDGLENVGEHIARGIAPVCQ